MAMRRSRTVKFAAPAVSLTLFIAWRTIALRSVAAAAAPANAPSGRSYARDVDWIGYADLQGKQAAQMAQTNSLDEINDHDDRAPVGRLPAERRASRPRRAV